MARFGGKYWNLGLSNSGLLSATEKQHFMLKRLTGIDHRNKGLTVEAAAELIAEALKKRKTMDTPLTNIGEQLLASIFRQATEAANEAGDKWVAEHPAVQFVITDPDTKTSIGVHGEIGKAWITWPQKGNTFYKWLSREMYDGQRKEIRIPHRYTARLEGDLQLACERAAYEVFIGSGSPVGDIKLMYRHEGTQAQAA